MELKFKIRNRCIVKAYVTYGMTYAQIGEEYGVTCQAIANHMKRRLRKEMRRFALEYPDIFKWKYSEFMRRTIPEIDNKMLDFLCEFWTTRSGVNALLRSHGYRCWAEIDAIRFNKRINSKRLRDLVFDLYDTIGGYTIEDDI